MLSIRKNLAEFPVPHAEDTITNDVRSGLGYCAVELESGHAGVARTPGNEGRSCTHMKNAGKLAGSPVQELLYMLCHDRSQLALSRVRGTSAVLKVVSEVGGMMLMKPYLYFINLPIAVCGNIQ